MMIKKIEISNFKSFKKLDLNLGDINVLIGANASGKSNFTQIFKFLKDIALYGLENAISLQGGAEYLRNYLLDESEELTISVTVTKFPSMYRVFYSQINEMFYEFGLDFSKKEIVTYDRLMLDVELSNIESNGSINEDTLESGELLISKSRNNPEFEVIIPEGLEIYNEILSRYSPGFGLSSRSLLIEAPFFEILPPFTKVFDEFAIYDFDPKLPKKTFPISGKIELDEDGGNLALVLKRIIEDPEKKRKLENLLKDLLPYIDTLSVEKFADKSLLFNLKENYNKNFNIPASLISDGTINLTALIVALFFEDRPLAIFEEPERNIHPYLISKVVGMLKDASRNKQIIVTTHNPEIVKHAGLENLLLISRDQDGFSNIQKPIEIQEVKTFLKNDIGIEELYIQNLLGE